MVGIIIFFAIVLSIIIVLVSRPMKIPREPDREGAEDSAALQAYYRASRWPIFIFERFIVLKSLAKIGPKGWLIDIGSGPGFLAAKISQKFPDSKVVGLDINNLTLENAKRTWLPDLYPELEFINADALKMPFPNNSVDCIVSSLSLHHWQNAQAVFDEIFRTLKPGGEFLIFDLTRDSPVYFYWALKIGQAVFAPKAIRNINGAVGSFWAAYTPCEIKATVRKFQVDNFQIKSRFGWMFISGVKPKKS
ncbi:MAG: class I SAM-dependent methyltransferase [Chitinivibrionales bacterium]